MESKLSRWCEGVLEIGWLVALIATPLFFNIHSARVFEPDKLTLLRSLALVMSVVWLVRFVDQRGWQRASWLRWRGEGSIWRLPFVLPVALLVVVYVLSTLFSVTPVVSWAGSYQRLQGTYTTLSYIVIFALMASTIRSREQVRRVVTTVILTSIPVALYAMLQRRDLDPLPWGGDVQRRVAGHLGNAIFIAAYLVMAVPLTAARILDAFTDILEETRLSVADIVRSSIYIFTLAIQLIAIYWSASRGPWLGLATGLFAFILIVLVSLRNAASDGRRFSATDALRAIGLVVGGAAALFFIFNLVTRALGERVASLAGPMGSFVAFALAVAAVVIAILILVVARRGWRWLWFAWLTVTVLVGVWLGAFNLADRWMPAVGDSPLIGGVVQTLDEWRDLPSIGRLGRLLQSDRGTGRVRVLIWEGVLELIEPHPPLTFPDGDKDPFNFLRPILGYGPESMYVAYNKYYPPELATIEARNASPDRSHNETFDALVITGAAGFLVWQALYLSVFYYAFRWLGVVRSRRDQGLLIGLWIAGAVLGGLLLTAWLGPEYLGVAVPFGSIVGLVLYLGYYALTSAGGEMESEASPFAANRLLLVGLVAAVAAHYVEIHFGIAIAATRTHFFAYLALLLLVGHVLVERWAEEPAPAAVEPARPTRRRRRPPARARTSPTWISPLFGAAIVLAIIIGTLGYNFTTFSLPEGQVIQSVEQIPSAGEIFRQSFFVHPGRGFASSPFVYLLVMMTWALGVIVFLAEMVKEGTLPALTAPPLNGERRSVDGKTRLAAGIFGLWAVLGLLLRFLPPAAPLDVTAQLGRSLMLVWAAVAAYIASTLYLGAERSRIAGGLAATAAVALSVPLFFAAEGGYGFLFLAGGGLALYLLWDGTWGASLLPALTLALVSLTSGLTYAILQAGQVRDSITAPPGVTAETPEVVRRVLEAEQATGYLALFYAFVFALLFVGGLALAWRHGGQARDWGRSPAFAILAVFLPLAFVGVYTTNMRIIDADVVYKRGDPWERQAARTGDLATWDVAIAIYERAIELAPREDFYYLFLGRAYLEKASLLGEDDAARQVLLETASDRLERAQELNPLNTDHTANLARLNTRWADTAAGAERAEKIALAESYYARAVDLSPQNAVIRNERARLAYALERDCDRSLDRYDESATVDPFYAATRFEKAEVLIACANDAADAEIKDDLYRQAAAMFEEGFGLEDSDPRRWSQLAQVYDELGQYDEALAAYDQARDKENARFPAWRTSYAMSTIAQKSGDTTLAVRYAEESLAGAPGEQQAQIQAYIAQLTGEPLPEPTPLAPEASLDGFQRLTTERPLATVDPSSRVNFYDAYPSMIIDPGTVYDAVIVSERGEMRLRLFADRAPRTVNNFVFLATEGYYDGVTFHRVLEDFMAQGGDPAGTGTGGPGYLFADEIDPQLTFDRGGLLAMANAGPDTNGSQFFITFGPTPWLDGRHTIFGELIAGADVLASLTLRDPATGSPPPGDRIQRIDILVSGG